jgi:hypothetical protein
LLEQVAEVEAVVVVPGMDPRADDLELVGANVP